MPYTTPPENQPPAQVVNIVKPVVEKDGTKVPVVIGVPPSASDIKAVFVKPGKIPQCVFGPPTNKQK